MTQEPQKILILGTRTLAVEFADVISEIPSVRLAGFVENMDRDKCTETLEGKPIYWIDDTKRLAPTHKAICGLATTHRHKFVTQARNHTMPFATLVHPTAHISAKTTLGEGTFVSPRAVVASHTRIGQHVIINRGVLIGHHAAIGDCVTIQPGANIAGLCSIGDRSYIGMGAVIIDRVKIGSETVIGAGAVVTRDIPDNVQVIGVPARIVKENIEGK